MKNAYLITYDFEGDAKNYSALFDAIKSFRGWWHYLDRTWLITTEMNAKEIFAILKPHLDKKINLLVIEVGAERQGWLPPKAWDWFKRHIDDV